MVYNICFFSYGSTAYFQVMEVVDFWWNLGEITF